MSRLVLEYYLRKIKRGSQQEERFKKRPKGSKGPKGQKREDLLRPLGRFFKAQTIKLA